MASCIWNLHCSCKYIVMQQSEPKNTCAEMYICTLEVFGLCLDKTGAKLHLVDKWPTLSRVNAPLRPSHHLLYGGREEVWVVWCGQRTKKGSDEVVQGSERRTDLAVIFC
jgi:hypothetical protein